MVGELQEEHSELQDEYEALEARHNDLQRQLAAVNARQKDVGELVDKAGIGVTHLIEEGGADDFVGLRKYSSVLRKFTPMIVARSTVRDILILSTHTSKSLGPRSPISYESARQRREPVDCKRHGALAALPVVRLEELSFRSWSRSYCM
jgi:hypothetical protein